MRKRITKMMAMTNVSVAESNRTVPKVCGGVGVGSITVDVAAACEDSNSDEASDEADIQYDAKKGEEGDAAQTTDEEEADESVESCGA
jgi:hypothetical protein